MQLVVLLIWLLSLCCSAYALGRGSMRAEILRLEKKIAENQIEQLRELIDLWGTLNEKTRRSAEKIDESPQ